MNQSTFFVSSLIVGVDDDDDDDVVVVEEKNLMNFSMNLFSEYNNHQDV